jgi:hypothetical protein
MDGMDLYGFYFLYVTSLGLEDVIAHVETLKNLP